MKSNVFVLALLLFSFWGEINAQGANCLGADPFCSDQSYTFPASTNTTAESGPDYSCLGSQPNPAWYYLQVANSGDIEITLTNSENVDIDFTCWGPFSSPTAPCTSQLTYDDGNPGWLQGPCGGSINPVSSYPCGNTVDCSFTTDATEVVNIPNAQAGDYYIIMITNYSEQPTDISAQQTGGTGSTDCSIVNPCTISDITTTVSSCDGTNNQYSVSGVISFTDAPATGQLIVEDCSGNQQTFNAPFGTSQNYNFTGLNSNGANCNITAHFTDDVTCTFTQNYTAPAACMCNADAGTLTVTINGNSTNNYVLCDGDQITIQSNNDFTNPLDQGIINGATYDPDLGFAVYFCPPTPNTSPVNDPCFSGYFTGTLGNFIETNNGGTSPLLASLIANGVTITNNTIYIAPVTLYNGANQVYDQACFDVGDAIAITYLQPITTTFNESCANSTSDVTITGGYAQFNGSSFTLSNLTPSSASLSSTSVADGGVVTVSSLQAGDLYGFDITDGNGCSLNFSEGPFGGIVVDVHDTIICNGGTALLAPSITGGTPPYSYSWDNGSTTPSISVSPTVQETHCITVNDGAGCSSGSQCIDVNIFPNLVVSTSNDTTICLGDTAFLSASAIGGQGSPYNFTWDNGLGVGANVMAQPTMTTTYSVIVSDGCETPNNTASVLVTVVEPPVYSFSANQTSGCPPLSVLFNATGVPSSYNQKWYFGDGATAETSDNAGHIYNNPGCYTVGLEISSPEGCVSYDSIPSYICVDQPPFVDFDYTPNKPTTFTPEVMFDNQTTGATLYEWLIIDASHDTIRYLTENVTHTFPSEHGGIYQVCLIATNENGCSDVVCKNITIWEDIIIYVPNTFTPNNDNLNDVFTPNLSGIQPDTYTFRVFDRWGHLVFETKQLDKGWDGTVNGKLAKTDTYIWKIEVADIINNEEHKFLGHVNVLAEEE